LIPTLSKLLASLIILIPSSDKSLRMSARVRGKHPRVPYCEPRISSPLLVQILQLRYQIINNLGNDPAIYLALCQIRKKGMRNIVLDDVQGVQGLVECIRLWEVGGLTGVYVAESFHKRAFNATTNSNAQHLQ